LFRFSGEKGNKEISVGAASNPGRNTTIYVNVIIVIIKFLSKAA